MKKTVLFDRHEKLNAKIVDFAGFLMPVSYSSVNEEHLHVRNSVGVFDVSHMGEIEISGSNSLDMNPDNSNSLEADFRDEISSYFSLSSLK